MIDRPFNVLAAIGNLNASIDANTLSTACPKPTPETEAAKRDRRIAQLKKLRASRKPIPRSLPVKKSNPKRQERSAVIRRQKHQAYRRSECYKAVERRAQGQCERVTKVHSSAVFEIGGGLGAVDYRCPNKRSDGLRMTHNHKTYARYGGKELPGDMELLCPSCNSAYESQKRGKRRFAGRGAEGGA